MNKQKLNEVITECMNQKVYVDRDKCKIEEFTDCVYNNLEGEE